MHDLVSFMKVLMINRDHSLWEGGDKRKVEHTISHLKKIGVNASYTCDSHSDYDADIIHLFHMSYPHSYDVCLNATRQRLPFIVSAVYSGERLPRSHQQEIVDSASRIIFLSEGELQYVRHRVTVDVFKVEIVKNGVSSDFHQEPKDGCYVLNVGRIYPKKNQLSLALACQRLGLPLKLIGQVMDKQYAREVSSYGAQILQNRHQIELIPFYQNARVLACVSLHEVQPNCVLEGGLCGVKIVLTRKCLSFTSGYPNIWLCDPTPDGIEVAIQEAWDSPKTDDLRRILSEWTWVKVARKLKGIYEEVLLDSN